MLLFVAAFALSMGNVMAQQKSDSTFLKVRYESFTPYFDKVEPMFEDFVDRNSLALIKKTKDFWEIECEVDITAEKYQQLRSMMVEWKCQDISLKEVTVYVSEEKQALLDKIMDWKSAIRERELVLDTLKDSYKRDRLVNSNKDDRERIRISENNIKNLEASIGKISLTVILKREMTTPKNGRRVKFVNMPGFEYSIFRPENPKPGLAADSYNGYNIKYVFTQGKSHVTVGVFKADNVADSSSCYKDIFNFSYGQDFYSRHMGRGGRRFLNVYSGYNIGFQVYTSEKKTAYTSEKKTLKTIYLSPSVGCEIYKNNFMLWDFKVNYVLPFSHNYDLRGLQFATSLNFSL